MNIKNFLATYDLHDSLITKITHNDDIVNFELEFCYWRQEGYKDGEPETGIIELRFTNVQRFENGIQLGDIDYYSILEARIENDTIILNILDDFNDAYYTISLEAKEVIVSKI